MNFLKLMHQGIADPSHSMANKGGSSGSPYYENMDRLYGAQARAAEFMLDQSMPRLPEYMQNTQDMTADAMSGALGNRLRDRAGADADAAAGNALAMMNQNLASYGVNPNSGLFAGQNRKLAVSNAANKTMAMNQAGLAAEDQKWNRNAGALAQATGMGSGAMSGMSSAGSGYGQMAGQMANQDAANAQGFGQFGAALAKSAFADGGEVRGLKRGVKLAMGGDAWSAWKNQNPIQAGGPMAGGSNPLGGVVMGAAPIVAGEALKEAGIGKAIKGGLQSASNAIGNAVNGAMSSGAAEAGLAAGSEQAAMLAAQDAAFLDAGSAAAGNVAAETAAAAGAETAGTAAAEGLATAGGAMTGLAAAAPWLVGGYALGSALDLWAEGGEVPHKGDPRGLKRKDLRPGGKVAGPGTETSDDIPAWLSDGEFVLNARAVELIGKKKLEALNTLGLKVRSGTNRSEAKKKAAGLKLKGASRAKD